MTKTSTKYVTISLNLDENSARYNRNKTNDHLGIILQRQIRAWHFASNCDKNYLWVRNGSSQLDSVNKTQETVFYHIPKHYQENGMKRSGVFVTNFGVWQKKTNFSIGTKTKEKREIKS